jgi:hypothetical protein
MQINWVFHILANNDRALRRVIGRVEESLLSPLTISRARHYEDRGHFYRVEAHSIHEDKNSRPIIAALTVVQRLDYRWLVQLSDGGFEGQNEGVRKIPGVEGISFWVEWN